MTKTQQLILAALRELDRAAANAPSARTKPDLLPIMARLDRLTAKLPLSTNPLLLHFLHRKSYQKALQLLQESAITKKT